jgi:hypothetical protein
MGGSGEQWQAATCLPLCVLFVFLLHQAEMLGDFTNGQATSSIMLAIGELSFFGLLAMPWAVDLHAGLCSSILSALNAFFAMIILVSGFMLTFPTAVE